MTTPPPNPQQGRPESPAQHAPAQGSQPPRDWPQHGQAAPPRHWPQHGQAAPPPYAPQPSQPGPHPQSGAGFGRILLHVLCPLLIIVGISAPMDGEGSIMWTSEPTWAALTTLAALVQAAAVFPRHQLGGRAWVTGAAAAGVLLLTWTLIFLPGVSSNRGFMVTLGVVAAGVAVWLSPDRRQIL